LTAVSQAEEYAKSRSGCKRLIVTDGLRYGVYVKEEGQFCLYAYFDITDLKEIYPVYECLGIKEALQAMSPEWEASGD